MERWGECVDGKWGWDWLVGWLVGWVDGWLESKTMTINPRSVPASSIHVLPTPTPPIHLPHFSSPPHPHPPTLTHLEQDVGEHELDLLDDLVLVHVRVELVARREPRQGRAQAPPLEDDL